MLRLRRVLTPKKPPPTPEPEVHDRHDALLVPFSMLRLGGRFRTGIGPNASWLIKYTQTIGHPVNSDIDFTGDRQFIAPDSLVVAWSDQELTPSARDHLQLLSRVGTRDEDSLTGPAPGRGPQLITSRLSSLVQPVPQDQSTIVTLFRFVRLGSHFYNCDPSERGAIRFCRDDFEFAVSGSGISRRFLQSEIVYVTNTSELNPEGWQDYRNRALT